MLQVDSCFKNLYSNCHECLAQHVPHFTVSSKSAIRKLEYWYCESTKRTESAEIAAGKLRKYFVYHCDMVFWIIFVYVYIDKYILPVMNYMIFLIFYIKYGRVIH